MATCSWAVYLPSSDFKHSEGEILERILNNKWCGSNSLPGSGRELFSCIRVFFPLATGLQHQKGHHINHS